MVTLLPDDLLWFLSGREVNTAKYHQRIAIRNFGATESECDAVDLALILK
jgi:hypothetical protein